MYIIIQRFQQGKQYSSKSDVLQRFCRRLQMQFIIYHGNIKINNIISVKNYFEYLWKILLLVQKVIKISIKQPKMFQQDTTFNQKEEQNQPLLDLYIEIHLIKTMINCILYQGFLLQRNKQDKNVVKYIKKSTNKIMKKQFILYVGYNQDSQYVELHIQRQHPQTL
ncbi:hypothetical protein pb186bvf_014265 [Paramecium bursaria]